MANLRQIKSKIKSVQNLKKITKALEIVSTVKLQKSKTKAESLKKYLMDLLFILQNLGSKVDIFNEKTKIKSNKKLIFVVTSERGLCGALNSKLLRQIVSENKEDKDNIDFFVIGKKGLDILSRAGYTVVGSTFLKDDFVDTDLLPVFEYLNKALLHGEYRDVKIYFNYFKNTLTQIPANFQIYPFDKSYFDQFLGNLEVEYDLKSNVLHKDLVLEPTTEILLAEVKRQIRNYLIVSAIIQNKAGEHASRMIAMKSAKDNSSKLITDLTLAFNKVRQGSITQEISEIVSAKIAIEN